MDVFSGFGLLPRSRRGASVQGQVVGIEPDPDQPGNPKIRVRLTDPRSDGGIVTVRPAEVATRRTPLARLGPQPAAMEAPQSWQDIPGLTFEVGKAQNVVRARKDDKSLGHLLWHPTQEGGYEGGVIRSVQVEEPYRRMGLATELLRRAREIDPGVRHSTALTPEGEAWSQVARMEDDRFEAWAAHADNTPIFDLPEFREIDFGWPNGARVESFATVWALSPGTTPESSVAVITEALDHNNLPWAYSDFGILVPKRQTTRLPRDYDWHNAPGHTLEVAEPDPTPVYGTFTQGAWVHDPKDGFQGQVTGWYNSVHNGVIVTDPISGEQKYKKMDQLQPIAGPGQLPEGEEREIYPEPPQFASPPGQLAPLVHPPEWENWTEPEQKNGWVYQQMEKDLSAWRGQSFKFDLGKDSDPEVTLALANRYRELVNLDPATARRIDAVTDEPGAERINPTYVFDKPGTVAVAWPGTVHLSGLGQKMWASLIQLNMQWFNDPRRWQAMHDLSDYGTTKGKEPWSIDELHSDPRLVLTHEFGHHRQYRLINSGTGEVGRAWSDVIQPDGFGKVPDPTAWAETQQARYQIRRINPTQYGQSRSLEAYAEAWTAIQTGDASPELVQQFTEYERRMGVADALPDTHYDPEDRRSYLTLTEEEEGAYWEDAGQYFDLPEMKETYSESYLEYLDWQERQQESIFGLPVQPAAMTSPVHIATYPTPSLGMVIEQGGINYTIRRIERADNGKLIIYLEAPTTGDVYRSIINRNGAWSQIRWEKPVRFWEDIMAEAMV